MPSAPLKRCSYPHCIELTSGGRCDQHKHKAWEHKKGTKRVILGRTLQTERKRLFRESNGLCAECLKVGRYSVATIRDHIVPLAEGGADESANTQALCQACSDRKTAEESKRGRKWRD